MQKMQTKKPRIKTRPLTKNEKFLITMLSIVLLIWGSNRFVFEPQAEKLYDLEVSKSDYDMRIIDINNTLKSESKINEEWDTLHKERDQILARYFPVLDQSQIIYLLNDLTKEENFSTDDYSFSRPTDEKLGEVDVRKMEISMPFVGNYNGIIDVLNALNSSPRRILVNNLSLDKKSDTDLNGAMSLKIYSLEGIAETNPDVIYVETAENSGEGVPFKPYGDYAKSDGKSGSDGDYIIDEDGVLIPTPDVKAGMRKELLHEFDYLSYAFLPSNQRVKGNISPSSIKKSGKYSMRFEYNILALEDENRAYIDLSAADIQFKIAPDTIGTWIYSYGYSPGTLGMRLKTQDGQYLDTKMVEGMNWLGWSYVETHIPSDLNLYPLSLEKLYFEIPYNRDDYGVFLMDKMEAFYRINGEVESEDYVQEHYEFYVVQAGDSVTRISEQFYGNGMYKNEIMQLNDIKPGDTLFVGKVLVLKRR